MKITREPAGTVIFKKGHYKDERLVMLIEGQIVSVILSSIVYLLFKKSNPESILVRKHTIWGAEQFMDKAKID